MDATWIGSPNYNAGRNGVEFVVPHHAASTSLANVDAVFANSGNQVSTHYGIQGGTVHQYVNEGDTSWANGNWDANTKSVTFEMVNSSAGGDWPIADDTYETAAQLTADVLKRYGLGRASYPGTVRMHRDFYATACPGEWFASRIQQFCDRVNAIIDGGSVPQGPHQEPGDPANDAGLSYRAHVAALGWLDPVRDGQTAGTTGHGLQLEALKIDPPDGLELDAKLHIEDVGWTTFVDVAKNDPVIGTEGRALRAEAMELDVKSNTTGKRLWYQVHLADVGWTGWVEQGYAAGTVGIGKAIEAVRMKLV